MDIRAKRFNDRLKARMNEILSFDIDQSMLVNVSHLFHENSMLSGDIAESFSEYLADKSRNLLIEGEPFIANPTYSIALYKLYSVKPILR